MQNWSSPEKALPPEWTVKMGELHGRPLLNVDLIAGVYSRIHWRRGRYDEERDAMVASRHRQHVGANLISGITIQCHLVRAYTRCRDKNIYKYFIECISDLYVSCYSISLKHN